MVGGVVVVRLEWFLNPFLFMVGGDVVMLEWSLDPFLFMVG